MATDWLMPKTFDPHLNPQQIILVGCGGTGSHLARLLARLLSHMQSLRLNIPTLRLIDPDIVEAKNVGRQLFCPADIGSYKAEIISKRLSCAFGLPLEWVNEPFNTHKHLGQDRYGTILIDAVDNHLARQEIAKACQGSSVCALSCGNHHDSGQICLGNLSNLQEIHHYLDEAEKRERKLGNQESLHYLPTAYTLFPDLLQPETIELSTTPEISCVDLILQGEQDLLVNDAIALTASRYVQQILLRQPIQSFITFVHLAGMMSIKPVPITLENLKSYLKV